MGAIIISPLQLRMSREGSDQAWCLRSQKDSVWCTWKGLELSRKEEGSIGPPSTQESGQSPPALQKCLLEKPVAIVAPARQSVAEVLEWPLHGQNWWKLGCGDSDP